MDCVAAFYTMEPRSRDYWWAAIFSAAVPAVYTCMGGMRASLVTDVMQAVMAVVMLVYLLGVGTGVLSFISAQSSGTAQNLFTWAPKGGYQSAESALATALLQGFFSYPFHDPVCAPTAASPPEITPRSSRDHPEIAYDPSFGPP